MFRPLSFLPPPLLLHHCLLSFGEAGARPRRPLARPAHRKQPLLSSQLLQSQELNIYIYIRARARRDRRAPARRSSYYYILLFDEAKYSRIFNYIAVAAAGAAVVAVVHRGLVVSVVVVIVRDPWFDTPLVGIQTTLILDDTSVNFNGPICLDAFHVIPHNQQPTICDHVRGDNNQRLLVN